MEPTPHALARDERDARGLRAHLFECLGVRLEPELRHEAQAADEAQRILGKAARPNGAEHAVPQIVGSSERIDYLPRFQPPRHRVHGEVAAPHVSLDREGGVGDDLELVPARPGASLGTRRRELDPSGREAAKLRVPGMETRADAPPGDLELLHLAVRLDSE